MNENQQGCVYLVGAGCGAADLITVRGLHLLEHCDAVVYDDLIDGALLGAVPVDAERIYVGKRAGKHSAPQAEISAILVQQAASGKRVVRLKGGDPFVFGRGGEEILALQAAGIPYDEVPGISSSIAIPAAAGIPVTHRGASQSLHIITGHTADTADQLPENFSVYAKLPGTLVFLMGLGRLALITQKLIAGGKAPETPAAVISGGNALHPAAVRGTLADLAEKVAAAGVVSPAVIVVGQVAALDLSPTLSYPLAGMRIGLTGTQAVSQKLAAQLRELGATPVTVEASVLDALPVAYDFSALCSDRHWIVLTSSNGVRLFFRHLQRQGIDLRRLADCRFAVIGAATGETLRSFGIAPDLCPERYTSEGLSKALCAAVKPGEDVLLFRSAQGSPLLAEALADAKIPTRDIPLYTLHADPEVAANSTGTLETLDYLTFSSASGVELFFATHGAIPLQTTCVCIGDVTARALSQRYGKSFLTAREISAAGIVEAILNH